ncbi:MAG: hypothetical protein IJR22_00720 [Acidaminococcaceae bacterium]|nr:hypothetical protein [Acidaminococcaceae bacterium]
MMENRENQFAREDIVTLLCEVAAQYARRNGPPLKVLIYGGAAITLQHKFRTATHDIDYAPWEPSPLFADCVEDVGKRYRLFPKWMHRLEKFTSAPRFRENFYRHAEALHLDAESGNLSFLVQDSDWQLANKLCWFRRNRKNDGRDIVGILQGRGGDAAKQVSRIVRDVFGEDAACASDGTMLLAALERDINLGELAVRLDGRALYYEKVYSFLFPLLHRKDDLAAEKICWESRFWRTGEDVQASLARHGVHLPPIIVNHITRVLFDSEFWGLP